MANWELLINGNMGDPFLPYEEDNQIVVAQGWVPWWETAVETDPQWKNKTPVFSQTMLDGTATQQISTPFGTHVAGLWQQVPAAAGNKYELSMQAQAWSSEDPSPATKLEASDVNMQIGIDPTGGLDPHSPLIIWSNPVQPHCYWETIILNVTAEASLLTIFTKSAPTLPKRQQTVFWRIGFLRAIGRYKRSINIVGVGDTHMTVTPDRPEPGQTVNVQVSSTRNHARINLLVRDGNGEELPFSFHDKLQTADRTLWDYSFTAGADGLYEVRFVGDSGARLLALRLLRVAHETQLVPSASPLTNYKRVYVLLPPTADEKWLLSAAKGSFIGRYTIGFSADDAGMGDFENRHVIAINPHHWPELLTESWFTQHYPGITFTAVVANKPADLEAWLKAHVMKVL